MLKRRLQLNYLGILEQYAKGGSSISLNPVKQWGDIMQRHAISRAAAVFSRGLLRIADLSSIDESVSRERVAAVHPLLSEQQRRGAEGLLVWTVAQLSPDIDSIGKRRHMYLDVLPGCSSAASI